jgi:hypothetical protein
MVVQVVEVQPDDGSGRGPRIGCSIKLADQKSGQDLDPQVPAADSWPGPGPGACAARVLPAIGGMLFTDLPLGS